MDLYHNWKAAFHNYTDINNKLSFIEKNREDIGNQYDCVESQPVIFNEHQNRVLSFEDHQLENYEECDQRLAII